MVELLILCFFSFGCTLVAVALIKQRWGQQLLDIPNQRSSHTQPTPRGGGLGFAIAFALTSPIAALRGIEVPLLIWLVLMPLIVIGMLDDRQGVPAGVRYLVQLAAAGIAVACFGPFSFPWLEGFGGIGQVMAVILTVIGITASINFYNFMDGLDGLVAGTTAVELGFLAIYLHQPFLWLLVAALLGFLWWNWSPAKIFMGDVGSTMLGAAIALSLLNYDGSPVKTWSALAICLPLVGDAVYTLWRRLLRQENIFQAHRSHLYQRLQHAGWSHAQVASAYISLNGLVAVLLNQWDILGAGLSLAVVATAIGLGEYLLSKEKLAILP